MKNGYVLTSIDWCHCQYPSSNPVPAFMNKTEPSAWDPRCRSWYMFSIMSVESKVILDEPYLSNDGEIVYITFAKKY